MYELSGTTHHAATMLSASIYLCSTSFSFDDVWSHVQCPRQSNSVQHESKPRPPIIGPLQDPDPLVEELSMLSTRHPRNVTELIKGSYQVRTARRLTMLVTLRPAAYIRSQPVSTHPFRSFTRQLNPLCAFQFHSQFQCYRIYLSKH